MKTQGTDEELKEDSQMKTSGRSAPPLEYSRGPGPKKAQYGAPHLTH